MTQPKQKKNLLTRILSSIRFLVNPELNTDDRRGEPRIPCLYRLTFVTDVGIKGEADLLDVSRNGLRVETDELHPKGTTMALNPPNEEELTVFSPLMAQVVWTNVTANDKYRLGLALPSGLADEETWLDSVLESLGYSESGPQRRQHIRAEGAIDGRMTMDEDESKTTILVSVLDLGMGGALIKCPETLEKNAQFSLLLGPYDDLPQIELQGTILRAVAKPEQGLTLHPARFRPLDEREETLLREYILNLLEN